MVDKVTEPSKRALKALIGAVLIAVSVGLLLPGDLSGYITLGGEDVTQGALTVAQIILGIVGGMLVGAAITGKSILE